MTSSQVLGILLGMAVLSAVATSIYRLQELLNVRHRQRLVFLKINLILTWLVPIASLALIYFRAGKSIGSLLPASENLNQALMVSNARVLAFQADNSILSQITISVYLLGLLITLLRFVVNYSKMRSLLLSSSMVKIDDRSVRTSEFVTSPFSFGFLNPQIFIPTVFLKEKSEKSVNVVLTHEETHIKHRDPQWKLISLVTRALLFFTPTAIYLHRKLELEMEIECDRATMLKTDVSIGEYGNFLIEATAFVQNLKPNPMFSYMSDTNLRRRIEAMKAKTFYRPVLSGIFASLVLVVGLTAVAAVSGVSKLKGQYLVKAEILLNGKVVSTPQFIVIPNEPASMEMKSEHPQSALRMMLTVSDSASLQTPEGIDLKMAVEYKTQDKAFRANPRVIVLPGEDGTVTIGSDSGDNLEMRINAVRQ